MHQFEKTPAIDQDTRLIVTWLVGTRDEFAAHDFISDLGSRLTNRVQITTDGHKPYVAAIEGPSAVTLTSRS